MTVAEPMIPRTTVGSAVCAPMVSVAFDPTASLRSASGSTNTSISYRNVVEISSTPSTASTRAPGGKPLQSRTKRSSMSAELDLVAVDLDEPLGRHGRVVGVQAQGALGFVVDAPRAQVVHLFDDAEDPLGALHEPVEHRVHGAENGDRLRGLDLGDGGVQREGG